MTVADDFHELAEALFADGCPPATVRALMATPTGHDRATWRRWARETGLPGLAVPTDHGGSGLPPAVLGPVFEAAGAALVCAPLLSTVGMAVPLLLALDDAEAANRWLPRICTGELTATVALPAAVTVSADGLLTGDLGPVVDGATADLVLVLVDGAVFAVDHVAALHRTPLMSLDLTRRQAAVTASGVPATRLTGTPGDFLDVARTLLAAELVGVAQRSLDMTVGYARNRVQFGRPIGSFQAVKQRAAEMLTRVELARSAAAHAAECLGTPEQALSAALAKAYCAEAAREVTADAIQLHGGIGFTWEHDAHLYFKRAIAADELLGPAATQWARVADHLDRTC